MLTSLSIRALGVSRGERPLFAGFDLRLGAGEAVALTGANGAGKTSLLRAVAGFLRPDGGEIVFGADPGPVEPETARARGVHMVGHLDGLKGGRTAAEELTFQTRWLGGGDSGPAVEALGLGPLMGLEVRRLSAGQRRRLALARLIAAPRPLWLLDEPLTPLDARWREAFGEIMRAHLCGGGMILAAVHDPLPIPAREVRVGGEG
ncbi:MAG: heme ABC exporter ATP-binding protein CcmA [Brevundimonas sp.]